MDLFKDVFKERKWNQDPDVLTSQHDGMQHVVFFVNSMVVSLGFQTPCFWRYDWTPKTYLKHFLRRYLED